MGITTSCLWIVVSLCVSIISIIYELLRSYLQDMLSSLVRISLLKSLNGFHANLAALKLITSFRLSSLANIFLYKIPIGYENFLSKERSVLKLRSFVILVFNSGFHLFYSLFTRLTNWTNSGLKWFNECKFC